MKQQLDNRGKTPADRRLALSAPMIAQVLRGHPWLFDDVVPKRFGAHTGDVVALVAKDGKPVGHALYTQDSPIALRVLRVRGEPEVGASLWQERIGRAWAQRQTMLGRPGVREAAATNITTASGDASSIASAGWVGPSADPDATTAFRWLHGEGDRMPGVIVDWYDGVGVLQLDTAAWLPHLDALVHALTAVAPLRCLWFRGVIGEPAIAAPRALMGSLPPMPLVVSEHGMRLEADVVQGQKTGLFLDQRENRAIVQRWARDRTVLNLFSYNGGFSVAAALGGATHVTSVDIAPAAIDSAQRTFAHNALAVPHETHAVDALEFARHCAATRRSFGFVIVDPPSFAPRKSAVPNALAAYRRLNADALRCVAPYGLFASASCSSHITEAMFLEMLQGAATDAKRRLRVLELRGQPPDHPVPLAFPEGRYLKFVLAEVEPG